MGVHQEVILLFKLPTRIQELIQHCISTVATSINWNMEPTTKFNSFPISHYLFVFALKRDVIQDKMNYDSWESLPFCRVEPKIFHICFVEDLILVVEANMEQVNLIREVLNSFCLNSSQKINQGHHKFFSPRMSLNILRLHLVMV